MKKYKYFALAAVILATTACEDDEIVKNITRPAEVGETILFGARAGFENANPKTRTEYGTEAERYQDAQGNWYDRIKWVDGTDKIEIYCNEASNGPSAHYVVKDASTDNGEGDHVDEAYLEKLTGVESSLQWGSGTDEEGTHTFYAMYPSASMFTEEDEGVTNMPDYVKEGKVAMGNATIKGYIDGVQETTVSQKTVDGLNHYTAAPDMRFAYMAAKTNTSRDEAYTLVNGKETGVNLTFYPIATAVEIELKLPTEEEENTSGTIQDLIIGGVRVLGTDIAGEFSASLSSWSGQAAFPDDCITKGTTLGEVKIRTFYDNKPITLKPGESLTFTVFLNPTTDITSLTIGIGDITNTKFKDKTISQNLEIKARKKNIINNLRLPVYTTSTSTNLTYENWMEQLPNNTSMSGISLPGTGGSFSYGSTESAYYKSQTLTFDEQWNLGIRAYEIVTSQQQSNFADEVLICNKQNITLNGSNLTVGAVIDSLLEKLHDNPMETAMAIFLYQDEGAFLWWGDGRNVANYMEKFMNYINTLESDDLVLYTPGLQLGEYAASDYDENGELKENHGPSNGARGKLMIVVRPTQKDQDEETVWTNDVLPHFTGENAGQNAKKVLAINGCGSGKDKWGARGYTMKITSQAGATANDSTDVYNISNGKSDYIEQFMQTENSPIFTTTEANGEYSYTTMTSPISIGQQSWYEDTRKTAIIYRAQKDKMPEPTDPNRLKFNYTTNTGNDCWYQEWARVIETPIWYSEGLYPTAEWFESYQEKLSNAKTTFKMAISGSYPSYTFINSLCGYFGESTLSESIRPSTGSTYGGAGGNIKGLATRLNKEFYEFVLNTPLTGPTGVVLMDYVAKEPSAEDGGGSYYLPMMLIGNNKFKEGVVAPPITGGGDGAGGGTTNPW